MAPSTLPWPEKADVQRPPADYAKSGLQQTTNAAPRSRPGYTPGSTSQSYRGGAGTRFKHQTRTANFDALANSNLQTTESSSSDEGLHPSRLQQRQSQRPSLGHGRSMSHPFPSLFPVAKKKRQPRAGILEESDSDSADDIAPMTKSKQTQSKPLPPPSTRGHRPGHSSGSKDFATGNCMTCGSLVRWPRDLSVFKCTICMTINDLEPAGSDQGKEGGPRTAGGMETQQDTPISLEQTRALVQRSLRSFLLSLLARSPAGLDAAEGSESKLKARPSEDGSARPGFATGGSLALRPKPPSFYVSNPFIDGHPEPTLDSNQIRRTNPSPRSYSTSYPEGRPTLHDLPSAAGRSYPDYSHTEHNADVETRRIFKSVEDYLVNSLTSFHSLNNSFAVHHRPSPHRRVTEEAPRRRPQEPRKDSADGDHPIADLDPKLLLLGDFAENGSWWTGGQEDLRLGRTSSYKSEDGSSLVSTRSPHINWNDVDSWYLTIIEAARPWRAVYDGLVKEQEHLAVSDARLLVVEQQILEAQEHLQRVLLKATETILKRPGRIVTEPSDLRFLLIVAANPLLHSSHRPFTGYFTHLEVGPGGGNGSSSHSRGSGPASGRHSGIIKRILGLMSNAPPECHTHLTAWFARYPEARFVQLKDLVSGFLAYRLVRQNEKKFEAKVDVTDGLIPSMSAGRSAASLHAALGQRSSSNKKTKERPVKMVYQDDWQIKASCQVMACIFTANNAARTRRSLPGSATQHHVTYSTRDRVQARGQILSTSDFYITLLDDSDLVADFEAWERKSGKLSFCQYPFLLSIGAKIQILEHDAKRQMQTKARDAFFDSIMTRRNIEQFLTLHIRRDCLVEDSLKAVRGVIGSGGEDIKKGLRIIFTGEEGVDAGGLRKEWFLLLVREVFNPDHGMFAYDEDSKYCYFNPNSLEPSEQFFLVGVVFGLAIYNSTILDVALPPFAFRKLLMAAPPPAVSSLSSSAVAVSQQSRQSMVYTLDDLAEYRPGIASGLRKLLEFDGDVESTFCLDFVIDTDKYGEIGRVNLCPGGDKRTVTNANRREYVDLYVRYLLDTAVARQFEPFKRGFFTVCGGNALSLFRPEEIELLVRGSDEALDIDGLMAAATYIGWDTPSQSSPGVRSTRNRGGNPVETEPTIAWFWESFERASPRDQRRLLLFITGSDRIPAMGAASLGIRVSCAGDDCGRFPTARTCFNTLVLYRCPTRERLEHVLWTAVNESEGFGLK